jgi:hypothetical protein
MKWKGLSAFETVPYPKAFITVQKDLGQCGPSKDRDFPQWS